MAKGYWIAHVDTSDPAGYEAYKQANAAPFAEFGARFVVRGGPQSVVEGQSKARSVVIEFPSYDAAVACYESSSYQAAKALRDPISSADMIIVGGYDD